MFLKNWQHFDFLLLGAMLILIIFSVAMIDSAIAGNIELIENDTVGRQIIFAILGVGVIIIITLLDYHVWTTAGPVLYVITFSFLVTILITGDTQFGATRWILGIQPSELAKISIILVLAQYFNNNKERVGELRTVLYSGVIAAGLLVLIFIQPDLSTSMVLLVIWGALLFASGPRWQHIALLAGIGVASPILGWPLMEQYQKNRIIQFLFPDPAARFGEEYNVTQAKITLGSGGWLGQGYGQGSQVQLRFLKVRHSDFIFSAIGAELGFVGTVLLMLLLLFILFRIMRAARLSHDVYGALICYGVAVLLFFQMAVNMGMNLNLMPVTGLPLPFISQGGSSLLSLMLGIGLVQSVVARHKRLEF